MKELRTPAGERGMALVVAILILLVLTLLATLLMTATAINRQVAGQGQLQRKALDYAEAGIAEAVMRIRNSDVAMVPSNPRGAAQIYLAAAGSIPAVGTDTTAMPTAQPTGNWLPYSTATKGPNVLTVNYKTDPGRTVIYRYDPTRNPSVQTTSGLPIYQITSTGRAGNAVRTIVTEVTAKPINANIKGALAAGMDVDFVGNAIVCGFNHSASTPPPTGDNGRTNNPSCMPYETHSGDLPATWSTGNVINGGASYQTGSPQDSLPNQTGFYAGPWQALGMSQSDFIGFVGAPTTSPSTLNGITYIDNDLVMGNQSASAAFHNTSGEGLLYVDGDLTLNAGFTYIGLVYVEGDLRLNGQMWILGGLIVKGKTTVMMTGGATILYSSDAISQKIAQYGGQFSTLSWREK